jgi:hypothetical protein
LENELHNLMLLNFCYIKSCVKKGVPKESILAGSREHYKNCMLGAELLSSRPNWPQLPDELLLELIQAKGHSVSELLDVEVSYA